MSNDDGIVPETSRPGAPGIPSTPEERSNGMLAHMLGVIGFLGPLIFYITKKDSPFVLDASREALNFHLTILVGVVITLGCGALILGPVGIIFSILGGMAAQKGEVYRYPFRFEFIK